MPLIEQVVTEFSIWIDYIMSCRDQMIFKGYLTCHNENALKTWRNDTHRIRKAGCCGQSLRSHHETVLPHHSGCRVSSGGDTMRSNR